VLLACAALLAAAGTGALREALAGTAGTLLEALPFVALGAALRGVRIRGVDVARLATFAGCGCGRTPGALALPVAALTVLAFGPVVALARAVAALALARRRRPHGHAESGEPLDELAALVPYAVLGAAAAQLLRGSVATHALAPPLAFAAGAAAGAFSGCALGAVAAAAALRGAAPWCAAGILCAAGVFARPSAGGARALPCAPLWAAALAAAAAVAVAAQGGDGLVHPHLAVAGCAGVLFIALRAVRAPGGSVSALAPAIVAAALLLRAPAPAFTPEAATVAGAYAGAPVRFTGVIRRARDGTWMLVRYAITCCRADAAPDALALERDPGIAPGTWAALDGVWVAAPRGLRVHARRLRAVETPRDPFIYR
jgi:hypothetical protein